MINPYYKNIEKFLFAARAHGFQCKKNYGFIPFELVTQIVLRQFYIELYQNKIITRKEFDITAKRQNSMLSRYFTGFEFNNNIILSNNAIAVATKNATNDMDKLKNFEYSMYNKEHDVYYIDLTLIMYNNFKTSKDYVNKMENKE